MEPRLLLSADLAGAVQSLQMPQPAAPGEQGTAIVPIANQGVDNTRRPVDVTVYASADPTYDQADVPLGTGRARRGLAWNSSEQVTVGVTVPSWLAPHGYTLLSRVDPSQEISVSNELNNASTAGPQMTVAWQFGNLSGRSGSTTLTLPERDGSRVTFSLTGPGLGGVVQDGNQWDVRVTGTDATSVLGISFNGGDGRTVINDLQIAGSLARIEAPHADLTG